MRTSSAPFARIFRPLVRSLLAAATTAVALAALTSTARATVVQTTYRTVNNGPTDFGSGSHSFGGPSGNATITYDWSTTSGSLSITGRVRGALYWDSLFSGGCARLTIRFRNAANVSIGERISGVCGPGGDANDPNNQRAVDESFSSAGLDHIDLTVAQIRNGALVNPTTITVPQVSQKAFSVLINNGRADFGSSDPPGHHFGRPDDGGRIIFGRTSNGTVLSLVDGVLYYDSSTPISCATIEVDWLSSQTPTPAILEHYPDLNCGPGGDANLPANQTFVFRDPAFASLEKIRIIVEDTAAPKNGVLRTYGFAGQVGDFEVEPADAAARADEPLNYTFTWTVPEPLNWHDLDTLELRIMEGADPILHVRFEEAAGFLSVLNEATGRFGKGSPAGSDRRLQTRRATLDLSATTVGPVDSALGYRPF